MGRVPIKDRARVRPTCPRCPAGPGAVDKGLPLPPSSHLHPVSPSILCRRAEVMPQHSSSCRIRVPPLHLRPQCVGWVCTSQRAPAGGSAAVGSDLSRPWQVSWSPWASPGAGDKRQLQVEQPGSPQNKNKAPPDCALTPSGSQGHQALPWGQWELPEQCGRLRRMWPHWLKTRR